MFCSQAVAWGDLSCRLSLANCTSSTGSRDPNHHPLLGLRMDIRIDDLFQANDQMQILTRTVADNVSGSPVGASDRERLSRLFWQQAVEDGLSISLLAKHRHLGSARALLRPQFESMARGVWVKIAATDHELEGFANGISSPPKISALIQRLVDHRVGWVLQGIPLPLNNLWNRVGKILHDTAHRGTRAVARLGFANQGSDDHVAEDEVGVLYLAGSCTGLAGTAILEDVGRAKEAGVVWDMMDRFLKALKQIDQH